MRVVRYATKYRDKIIELLTSYKNSVELPSDVFFDIAKAFDGEDKDLATLDKLLSEAYTLLAVEGEEIAGVASMDDEGDIGIFVVCEGSDFFKTRKQLLNALDRHANQNGIGTLVVMPTDKCRIQFKKFGYKPFDGDGEPNESLLVKETEEKPDFLPSEAKRITLDPKKPIVVEGKTSVIPTLLLITALFFATLYVIITAARYGSEYFERKSSEFVIIGCVVGVIFVVAVTVFAAYIVRGKRLKKKTLSMKITNAIVVSHTEDSYWDLNGEHNYTKSYQSRTPDKTTHYLSYIYYDEDGKLHNAQFSHRYVGRGAYYYKGQELIVAYSENESFILRRYTILKSEGGEEAREEAEQNEEINSNTRENSDGFIPLYCVKMYYVIALSFAIMCAIVFAIAVIIAAVNTSLTDAAFAKQLFIVLPIIIFGFAATGLPAIFILGFILHNKIKFKRLKNNPDTRVYIGKLVNGTGAHNADSELKFYCEYTEGNEKKRMRVPRKFPAMLLKKGKVAVKVIVNGSTRMVLVERGKYPDVWNFFLPHY